MDEYDRKQTSRRGEPPRPRPRPRKRASAPPARTRSSADGSRRQPAHRGPAHPPVRGGKKRPSRPRGRISRRQQIWRTVALATGVLVLAGLIIGAIGVFALSRDLPEPGTKPKGRDQTSVITDRNGEVIAKLFAEQDRTDRTLADIPVPLRQAVISTEDQRFYLHKGVDPWGIARALWVDATQGKSHGGSTITQQYVKTAFLTPEQTLTRKIKEAIFAYRVEKELSKDQILELYLNTIYFGHGAYGVEAASQAYFGTTVDKLTLAQSAVIAGVIKSPGRYSPYLDPTAGRLRRDTVLAQMAEQGYITAEELAAAESEEIVLKGLTSAASVAPYFAEYVKARLIDTYGADVVYRGGITVRTTLDLKMQRIAEKAVTDILDKADDPSAALVALNPTTGEILAMVGGRDFSAQQFNVAVQGRRQPGSAFKPFVLLSALEQGVSPEARFPAGPASFRLPNGQTWKVSGAGGGMLRLRQATEKSVNSVFAKLILDTNPEKTVEMAERLGIHKGISPVPAIALGGLEEGVSPLEMASAYGTLAAGGKHTIPFGIAEVANDEGEILHSGETSATQAITPALAFLASDIMRGVIANGTGKSAAIGRPAAGKTGTTQEYRDAWFVGYTPQLVTAVWVGYPDTQKEMKNVHGMAVTGGSFPAKIWSRFMKGALESTPELDFVKPKGVTPKTICVETGLVATEFCPTKTSGIFLDAKLPGTCTTHAAPLKITVPKLVGMTKEAALAALKQLMLLFKVIEQDVPGVAAGIVSAQDPAYGSAGTTQTVVTITVSNGGSADLPPKADFVISPSEGVVGEPVDFDASAASDDGKIAKYYWEFGDGTEDEGKKLTHTFTAPGTFEVTLWVTDDKGQTSSVTKSLVVK